MPDFMRRVFRRRRAPPSPSSPPSAATTQAIPNAAIQRPSLVQGVPFVGPDLLVEEDHATRNAQVPPSASSQALASRTAKGGWGVAWNALVASLTILEKSSDAFPPLKSATGSLLACINLIQAAADNAEDYESMASELNAIVETITRYSSELASSGHTGNVARILKSIDVEASYIQRKQVHSRIRRVIEGSQDKQDIINGYKRIESLFRQLNTDIGLRTWDNTRKLRERSQLQELFPVLDARYDSSYSSTINRRGCTPKTREQVQQDLQNWTEDPTGATVYWMNGMAGSGKTTIAYSLCEWLENEKRLGGSFCCSRLSNTCNKAESILPTIAYQLAQYSPAFQAALCNALDANPNASQRHIRWQFQKLIEEPLRKVAGAMEQGVIVVIDALDECMDTAAVGLFLETTLKLVVDLPIKFFFTSRPEPVIQDKFRASKFSKSVLHLHDIEESIVAGDIKLYLTEAFSSMDSLPSPSEIQQLADRSGKLFIYAATVVRYIVPPDNFSVDSTERLQTVLNSSPAGSTKLYDELNALYSGILFSALKNPKQEEKETDNRRLVLWTSVCAREPVTIKTLASLLKLTEREVTFALRPLQSLLHVQERGGLVSALHASFPDYIFDQKRSKEFFCDNLRHNEVLAKSCFAVMKSELRFNICCLESSFILDEEVPGLKDRVEKYISPVLSYACRYWGIHLQQGTNSAAVHAGLVDFLTIRLLFWMEVLNLQKNIKIGELNLEQAKTWLTEQQTEVRTLVVDATAFVVRYTAGACSLSTPHIYISSLPMSPRSTSVYKNHWKHTHGLLRVDGAAVEQNAGASLGVWLARSIVLSVAFSASSNSIVCGLHDFTIRVLDARTGKLVVGPITGHTGGVTSVAFSEDETRIVSASTDRTVRIWDAQTGQSIAGPFIGHAGSVESVAISQDGNWIISGSDDGTLRVIKVQTGELVAGPFTGHEGWVASVALSRDDKCIATGSYDRTIRVWDVNTGQQISEPLRGHGGWVHSVDFSWDGTRIASGSSDRTIRVWDAQDGALIAGPFRGHDASVLSVAFSRDGRRIASGSKDKTIRVWDVQTGELFAGPFTGHEDFIKSVAFSRDDKRIISGSYDGTLRVWDAETRNSIAKAFAGHGDAVECVAYARDGSLVASGSADRTFGIWDAHTGQSITGLIPSQMQISAAFTSLVFSRDCTRILSFSDDEIGRVWDVHSGRLVAGPFRGHGNWVDNPKHFANGMHIVHSAARYSIQVLDAKTNQSVSRPITRPNNLVVDAAFSADGSRIVSGGRDKMIRVSDARSGSLIAGPFAGHVGWVVSVAFSNDGKRVVSGSDDKTIRVWDISLSDPAMEASNANDNLHGGFPHVSTFELHDDGWICSGNDRLLWIHPDIRSYLPYPHNPFVIGPSGTTVADYKGFVSLGKDWTKCYIPS